MIHFDLPKDQSSIIKVIGVGGGGSNAVNYMYSQNIDGVDFVICNTDSQALTLSKVPNKIQLGPTLTQGLGAGANPAIGRQATEESLEEIRRILEVNTKMVFVTAGMGGGTGTGGAPIVAKISRDLGILTVGIVTTPFSYEGKKRIQHAQEGIAQLKQYVDTLLVISNDKLRHQFGNLTMRAAFSTADNVLATAAKCITDVINSTGQINVDFADVCTVMRNGGVAILGSATAAGENRAQHAIEHALNSPLLNDNDIKGAKWILININSSEGANEFTMDEVEIIQQYIIAQAGPDTDVILGMGYDNALGDQIGITLIATGFEHKNPFDLPVSAETKKEATPEKEFLTLGPQPEKKVYTQAPKPVVEKDPMEPSLIEQSQPVANQTFKPAEPEKVETREVNELGIFDDGVLSLLPGYQIPAEDLTPPRDAAPAHPKPQSVTDFKDASTTVTLGGFLARPSNIYAQDPVVESNDQNPREEPHQLILPKDDDQSFDMQLVIKETPAAEEPRAPSTHVTLAPVEDPALQDETEEQKRKASERLHKLRNLSFNLNTADPNNEFENVPAYIRRNLQVHNTALTSVEKFYSKYEIKTDEHNKGQISTINTFLDGKKPD